MDTLPGSDLCQGMILEIVSKIWNVLVWFMTITAAQDMIIADMISGKCHPCDWLEEYIHFSKENKEFRISYGWLKRKAPFPIFIPKGDYFRKEYPYPRRVLETHTMHERLNFLRNKNGFDIYQDILTNQKVFLKEKTL